MEQSTSGAFERITNSRTQSSRKIVLPVLLAIIMIGSAFVVVSSSLAVPPQANVTLQGWTLKPESVKGWTTGNIKGYSEGDVVPVDMTVAINGDNHVTIIVGFEWGYGTLAETKMRGFDRVVTYPWVGDPDPLEHAFNDPVDYTPIPPDPPYEGPFSAGPGAAIVNQQYIGPIADGSPTWKIWDEWKLDVNLNPAVPTAHLRAGGLLFKTIPAVQLGAAYFPGASLHVRLIQVDEKKSAEDISLIVEEVMSPPRLVLEKFNTPTMVLVGDTMTIKLMWENLGQAPALGLTLWDIIPTGNLGQRLLKYGVTGTEYGRMWYAQGDYVSPVMPVAPPEVMPVPIDYPDDHPDAGTVTVDAWVWYDRGWVADGTGPYDANPLKVYYLEFEVTVIAWEYCDRTNYARMWYCDDHNLNPYHADAHDHFKILKPDIKIEKREKDDTTCAAGIYVKDVARKADVMFAVDLSGSMGYDLPQIKTAAAGIIDDMATAGVDARFGVMTFVDYPHSYSTTEPGSVPVTYSAAYGGGTDYAFKLDKGLTTDTTSVKAVINGLTAGGGADGPQDYARVIYEAYANPSIIWRAGAERIVVIFGDDVAHDSNFDWDNDGTKENTGGDPGRDEVLGTFDDLDFETEVTAAAAHGIHILGVFCGGAAPYEWKYMAAQTDGGVYTLADAPRVVQTVLVILQRSMDVMFAIDLSGSMWDDLDAIKAGIAGIMDDLINAGANPRFGVITFVDYPHSYSTTKPGSVPVTYSETYGSGSDYAYRLNKALTYDTGAVKTVVNGLVTYGGWDGPQDYTRIINEAWSDPLVKWRDGAGRFLVLFGDNVAHDSDFDYDNDLTKENTGGDPGQDEILGTADDLDFETEVARASARGVHVLSVLADPSIAFQHEYEYMADMTGGEFLILADIGTAAGIIADQIGGIPGPIFHPGDVVTYEIRVTNPSPDTPMEYNVYDGVIAVEMGYPGTTPIMHGILNPGMTTGWVPFTYRVKGNEPEPPEYRYRFRNTATVIAVDTFGLGAKLTDSADWDINVLHPGLSIVKTADCSIAAVGEKVMYTIVVENIGDATLDAYVISDSMLGGSLFVATKANSLDDLHPGDKLTLEGVDTGLPMHVYVPRLAHVVEPGDVWQDGYITNKAWIIAYDTQNHFLYRDYFLRILCVHPDIQITKTPVDKFGNPLDPAEVGISGVVRYEIKVVNTGDVGLWWFYWDDFADLTGIWTPMPTSPTPLYHAPGNVFVDGCWAVELDEVSPGDYDGVYCGQVPRAFAMDGLVAISTNNAFVGSDFSYSVMMYPQQAEWRAGVVFRYNTATGDGYFAYLYDNGLTGGVVLLKAQGGHLTVMGAHSMFLTHAWHMLRVEVKTVGPMSFFDVYVDGSMWPQISESELLGLPAGKVGLSVFTEGVATEVHFDDVLVKDSSDPAAPPLLEEHFEMLEPDGWVPEPLLEMPFADPPGVPSALECPYYHARLWAGYLEPTDPADVKYYTYEVQDDDKDPLVDVVYVYGWHTLDGRRGSEIIHPASYVTDNDDAVVRIRGWIFGYVYHDFDGDDTAYDPTAVPPPPVIIDTPLERWVVELCDYRGIPIPGRSYITGADGYYEFDNLDPTVYYKVRETLFSAEWFPTNPTGVLSELLTVHAGHGTQWDFGNMEYGYIEGYKWNDWNMNGNRDFVDPRDPSTLEPMLGGWWIMLNGWEYDDLDEFGNPIGNADHEQRVLTETSGPFQGWFKFKVKPGIWNVWELMPMDDPTTYDVDESAWFQTFPTPPGMHAHVGVAEATTISDKYFGNVPLTTIWGYKYYDKNMNGIFDDGDFGLNGWTMTLDDGNPTTPPLTTVSGKMSGADVVFVVDLSGSMSGYLGMIRTAAAGIMDDLVAAGVDAQFAVMTFVDYPGVYSTYEAGTVPETYSAAYGGGTDYAFKLDKALTTNTAAVKSVLNGLTIRNGADGPQDYSRVIHEAWNNPSLAWRYGAERIMVLFGDNVAHDSKFDYDADGVLENTGGDPGRDEILGTADDLDFETEVLASASRGLHIMGVFFGSSSARPEWDYMASRTDGGVYSISTANKIPDAISLLLRPAVDVMFAIDLSGSMADELAQVRAVAGGIMDDLVAAGVNAQFGVMTFVDYPGRYSTTEPGSVPLTYSEIYGGSADYAYKLDKLLTTDTAAVKAVLAGLIATGGADGPQDYSRIIHEAWKDPSLAQAWRYCAQRILVLFGDNVAHDSNFDYDNDGVNENTGGDPGRDEILGNADDLNFETEVANAAAHRIHIMGVFSGGVGSYEWQYMADLTGGGKYTLLNARAMINERIMSMLTGYFQFARLKPGVYTLGEIEPDGQEDYWYITTPSSALRIGIQMPTIPGMKLPGPRNVGNMRLAKVWGYKFVDLYRGTATDPIYPNGLFDSDESGYPGWPIHWKKVGGVEPVASPVNTMEDNPWTVEDETGKYVIWLVPGDYEIWEDEYLLSTWEATTPWKVWLTIPAHPWGPPVIKRLDFGNTRPLSDPSVPFVLEAGWNLWSTPVAVTGLTAAGLLKAIGPAGLLVTGLNDATAEYYSYMPEWDASLYDFPIQTGDGYYIYVTERVYFTLCGDVIAPGSVELASGWNIVGFNGLTTVKASEFLGMVEGCSALLVTSLDASTAEYYSYMAGWDAAYDFAIVPGKAYFVWVDGPGALVYR